MQLMNVTIWHGFRNYYFVPFGSTPPAPERNEKQQDLTFSGTTEAIAFLRRLGGDSLTGRLLRDVAQSVGVTNPADYDDTAIVELVARELVRKRLIVLARYRMPQSANSEQGAEKPAARPAPTPGPSPKALDPDPDTFPDPEVDQQVGALMAAARDGVPFCEECERAQRQHA
jgi:hypothetical protein